LACQWHRHRACFGICHTGSYCLVDGPYLALDLGIVSCTRSSGAGSDSCSLLQRCICVRVPFGRRTARQRIAPNINHEVKRLSKENVWRIPLVTYIPAPPSTHVAPIAEGSGLCGSYPPQPAVESRAEGARQKSVRKRWDDQWERGPHPFVRLTENQEACPICFEEYQQPRRKDRNEAQPPTANTLVTLMYSPITADTRNLSRTGIETVNNRGESLRLLDCGHVFHVRAAYSPLLRISS